MAGTRAGGLKIKATMIARLGVEGYYRWIAERGRTGGLAKVPKGFSMKSEEERSAAGHKGGKHRWGRETTREAS